MKNLADKKLVRLGQAYVTRITRDRLKAVGEKEKRSIVTQAAYVLEKWAEQQS